MRRVATAERSGGVEVLVTVAGAPPARRVEAWTRILLSKARAQRALRSPFSRSPSLSILLCGDRRMHTLNRRFRRVDRPTDVLSFLPLEEISSSSSFLGDLVIDVPYAARQARRRGHSTAREVQILLAHGVLHLLGYDHETDDGTMFRLQRRLVLSAFGPGPDGVP